MNTTSQLFLVVAALLVTPLLSLAQKGTMRRADETQSVRRFRAYLEEDWKRWMIEYPEMATGVGFRDRIGAGVTIRQRELRRARNICMKVWQR